jgi:hypothetical protein
MPWQEMHINNKGENNEKMEKTKNKCSTCDIKTMFVLKTIGLKKIPIFIMMIL